MVGRRVVIGAMVARFVRRQLPLLLIAAVLCALVIGSWIVWPLATWATVWSLVLVVGLVLASVFDLGETSLRRSGRVIPVCSDCDYDSYEVMECCASGSCEVCGGAQGRVREAVVRERHGAGDTR